MIQTHGLAIALLTVILTPNAALAFFGVNMSLDCKAITTCSAEGTCKPFDQTIALSITHIPVTDDTDSRFWPVRLTINGEIRDAEMVTESGPIIWGEMRATHNFLTPHLKGDNPMGLIWQRNDFEAGTTDVLFMSCDMKVD